MRYSPSAFEGTDKESTMPGELSLFVESQTPAEINFGDNLAVGPHSHLFVCEDQYTKVVKNKVRGVTPSGDIYNFVNVRWQTEPGECVFRQTTKPYSLICMHLQQLWQSQGHGII